LKLVYFSKYFKLEVKGVLHRTESKHKVDNIFYDMIQVWKHFSPRHVDIPTFMQVQKEPPTSLNKSKVL